MANIVVVKTVSSTVYEFDLDGMLMRRLGPDPLRGDGTWLKMLQEPVIEIHESMRIALEGLGDGPVTMRYSTPVVSIDDWSPKQ